MSARRWIVAVVVGAAWFAGEAAMGLTVQVQGASASPGDTPDVCVYLPDSDGTVAGVQLDLFWDSSCLSVDRSSGDQAACVMNPETKRSTFQTRVLSEGRLRAVLVSLNDVSPIPANVRQLFCCQFRVSPNAGGRTCGVSQLVQRDRLELERAAAERVRRARQHRGCRWCAGWRRARRRGGARESDGTSRDRGWKCAASSRGGRRWRRTRCRRARRGARAGGCCGCGSGSTSGASSARRRPRSGARCSATCDAGGAGCGGGRSCYAGHGSSHSCKHRKTGADERSDQGDVTGKDPWWRRYAYARDQEKSCGSDASRGDTGGNSCHASRGRCEAEGGKEGQLQAAR